MRLELHYKGNRSYGTGSYVNLYAAKLTGDEDTIRLKFLFPDPPSGLTNSDQSDARVKGFELFLDYPEALHIATALLAFSHHPTTSREEAFWMPLDQMPALDRAKWEDSVRLDLVDEITNSYRLTNDLKYHIGNVTIEFTYTNEDGAKGTFLIVYTVDLPPKGGFDIEVDYDNFPKEARFWSIVITNAAIIEVTGFDLNNLRACFEC